MELTKVSPTDVEGFDGRTTFGCPSKFNFKMVQGIPEPGNAATNLGDEVHAQCENTLVTGINSLGKIADPGFWFLEKVRPYVATFPVVEGSGLTFRHRAPGGLRGLGIELKFGKQAGYVLEGLPVTGRIDLFLDYGRPRADAPRVLQVHDHKTSSNIEAYGKSADDLLTNHQTSLYLGFARFKFGWGDGPNEMLRMSHGYFQTKNKKLFKPVETFVTIPQLEAQLDDTKKVIRAMKDVARETDIRKVDKNLNACDVGFGCPYKLRCPRGVSAVTSLLSRFKSAATPAQPAKPASPPPAAPPPAALAPPKAAVLAPDAPKSDPAKAAVEPKKRITIKDVETPAEEAQATLTEANATDTPEEAPVAKRGPGRPRKEAAEGPSIVFDSMSMTHGLTVNLGDRNFAKVEMSMTARFQGVAREEVEKQLGEYLRASVDKQLEKYAQEMDAAKAG